MDVRPSARSGPGRPAHPAQRELVGGVDLSVPALAKRPDAKSLELLSQMLSNAEYWLSFDVAAFEPLLAKSPTPLRELGVAVALRFGDVLDGSLTRADLGRARETLVPKLPSDLRPGVELGLTSLERAVEARDRVAELERDGFKRYVATQSLSVHALRAMGRSSITIAGHKDDEKKVEVRFGELLRLTSFDERGRPLSPPEVESHVEAPLWFRDEKEPNQRTIFLVVPGEYFVRVPGRATGDRKLIAL